MTLTQITKIRGAGIHTTSNIVSHNINSSGIITATAFVGDGSALIGVASTDNIVTGTAATFNNAVDINADLDVDGHTNLDNISVAGVSTFSGNANFSGNVSIGGTLTYEDVTNIDSVGLVTARTGVVSPYADIDDWIDVGNNIQLGNAGVITATTFKGGTFFGTDADINGDLDVDGHTNLDNVSIAGVTTATGNIIANSKIGIGSATPGRPLTITHADPRIRLQDTDSASGGFAEIYSDNNNDLHLTADASLSAGSSKIIFNVDGTNEKMRITSAGFVGIGTDGPDTKLHVLSTGNANTVLKLEPGTTAGNYGGIELGRTDGSGNIRMTTVVKGGVPISGISGILFGSENTNLPAIGFQTPNSSNGHIVFSPKGSEKLRITSGGTIQIGGETSNSADIDASNTKLTIKQSANSREDGIYIERSGERRGWYQYVGGGLSSDDALCFDTNQMGTDTSVLALDRSGDVKMAGKLLIGTTTEGEASADNLTVADAANAGITIRSGTGNYGSIYFSDGTSGAAEYDGWMQYLQGTGLLTFGTSQTTKLSIDTDGHITPGAAGTQDLGSAAKEFRDLYIGDSGRIRFGSDQDMFVFHDNVHGYVANRKNNLYLEAPNFVMITSADTNGSNQQTSARFFRGGASDLYYANSPKFSTSSTGVTVTGEVAATQDYPTARPTLDFNFAAVKKLDSRITYQRTGPASYTDEFGIVKLVGDNVPRFDHDGLDGDCLGLLIEETGTNTKTNSRDFSSGWNSSGVVYTQVTSVTTPEGITDEVGVGFIKEGQGGSVHQFYAASTSQVTKYITYSIFAKPNGRNHINLMSSPFVHNLSDGTTSGSASGEFISAKTTLLANGWCRCSVTVNHNNSYDQFNIKLHNGSGTSYSGNNSSGVYIWGVQQEDSSYLTSYIQTSGSTATRGTENIFIDGQDFTDAYNVPEGTFILKQSVDDTSTSNQWGWGVEKSGNRSGFFNGLGFRVGGGGAGYVGAWYNNNGTTQAFHNMNAGVLVNIPYVSAFAYKANDMTATTNGMTVATDSSATIANAGEFDRFSLGSYHYDSMSTGHIQRVMYYPKRLPNSQLVTLTS